MYDHWQMIESRGNNENIGSGETIHLEYYPYGFTTAWIGDRVFESSVTDLYFTISNLADISEVTWHIPIK